jgi:hypothetical protein
MLAETMETVMSSLNLNFVYSLLTNLEQSALKSTDARVQAFGASMSNTLTAFKDAVPGLAVAFTNAAIAEAAKAEPVLSVLIPAEALIDPAVSGFASMFENMLLGTPSAPAAPAQDKPTDPSQAAA